MKVIEGFYYTYVLRSLKNGNLYIGWTNDLEGRFKKHNSGKVFATRNWRPYRLVYCEACLSKEKAIAREKSLKTGFGRKYLKNRI